MPDDNLKVYTVADLERMASAYLLQRLGSDISIPIDVEWLVEKEGLDLDVWPALQANHKVIGAVLRDADSGRLQILVDETLADDESPRGRARYRMTVAEELAHVRLHRAAIAAVSTFAEFRALHNHSRWSDIERNAKRFAAAILIPARRLMPEAREVYPGLVRTAGTSNKQAIKTWLKAALARQFQVSEAAMDIRLGERPAEVYSHVERALDDGLDYLP